jgi:E3 ubiquitin-protein ligase RNF14
MAAFDERGEELNTLSAIYPELLLDVEGPFSASLELSVSPTRPLLVRFIPLAGHAGDSRAAYAIAAANGAAYIERDIEISHLPPLTLHISLPVAYPADTAPTVQLTAKYHWLPAHKLTELEQEAENLWNEYGHCQTLFAYIDYLQSAAERGFDLDQSLDGCLVLPVAAEKQLLAFDAETKSSIFNSGTYDCGICLEPKKGLACYELPSCGHIFCKSCLQDFFNNAISEGDVASVRCLSPGCGKQQTTATGAMRKHRANGALHPRDLLAMGIEESMVRRYVDMKRKKKIEADKTTVYCPRQWCQGAAKSPKYPPIPVDLLSYAVDDSSGDERSGNVPNGGDSSPLSPNPSSKEPSADPADRLAVCEKCSLAFCRVCYKGWHGQFARCYPRDPNELSAEEKASYDYILANTSPCPTCNSPTQKTMGCNHMKCYQCNTHFCYLCGSWLEGGNPYQHFNKAGTDCYQRLWELEEGDEGQRPADGRGFGGGRAWEQMAIEAARDADAQEAAARAQAEEDERAARRLEAENDGGADQAIIVNEIVQMRVQDVQAAAPERDPQVENRRQRNPFPARPLAPGAAMAVRHHERLQRRPVLNGDGL